MPTDGGVTWRIERVCGGVRMALLVGRPGLVPVQSQGAQQEPPPRILLDAAPRAIEYQLGRLTNAELARVERKPDDPRYRLVYVALLTRKGLGREYFDEALAALPKHGQGHAGPACCSRRCPRSPPTDEETADKLLRRRCSRSRLTRSARRARRSTRPIEARRPRRGSLQAAYGGMMLADGDAKPVWDAAAEARRPPDRVAAQRATPGQGAGRAGAAVRSRLPPSWPRPRIPPLARPRSDRAGLDAAGCGDVQAARTGDSREHRSRRSRAAAIRALAAHAQGGVARSASRAAGRARCVDVARATSRPDQRTEPDSIDAMQLAEKLADALPDEARRAARRDLRALGVQVVRIQTRPRTDVVRREMVRGRSRQAACRSCSRTPMRCRTTCWSVKPGSLQEVGNGGGAMPVSADPDVKPFVPGQPARACKRPACSIGARPSASVSLPRPNPASTPSSARSLATGCACTASCSWSPTWTRGRPSPRCRPTR